ncbi:MAG: cation diffusion facilitator family transporter, partial [Actinomycetota bacterium]|nr:cation diffusion facilitator family transporter [Actinomycetota bacterium]
ARADRRTRRLTMALAINVVVSGGQVVAGLAASSVSLLADAGHNLTDVAAIALSLYAIRLTRRPPDSNRSYGYHRSTVLAGQANAAILCAVTGIIAYQAILRLVHPHPVRGGLVALVALGALAANAVAARLLFERHGRDLNMRAAMLHMAADALASASVAAAGAVIWVTGGLNWLDPVVSLGVAVLIGAQSLALVRAAADVLLESTPSGLDVGALVETVIAVPGVEGVHDVHAWSLSADVSALSAHLVLLGHPSLEEAQLVGEAVKAAIAGSFGITHATLELECETCVTGDDPPCSMADLSAAHAAQSHAEGGPRHN